VAGAALRGLQVNRAASFGREELEEGAGKDRDSGVQEIEAADDSGPERQPQSRGTQPRIESGHSADKRWGYGGRGVRRNPPLVSRGYPTRGSQGRGSHRGWQRERRGVEGRQEGRRS